MSRSEDGFDDQFWDQCIAVADKFESICSSAASASSSSSSVWSSSSSSSTSSHSLSSSSVASSSKQSLLDQDYWRTPKQGQMVCAMTTPRLSTTGPLLPMQSPSSSDDKSTLSSSLNLKNVLSKPIRDQVTSSIHQPTTTSHVKFQNQNPVKFAANAELSIEAAGPNCGGHSLPCISLAVKKDGPTKGRLFWTCPLQQNQKCKFFVWDSDWKTSLIKSSSTASSSLRTPNLNRPLTITLQWLSPHRFSAEFLPFDESIPVLFRTIPQFSYSITSKSWTFPFTSYRLFKEALSRIEGFKVTLVDVPEHLVKLVSELTDTHSSNGSVAGSQVKKRKILNSHSLLNLELDEFEPSRIPPELWTKLMPFQRAGIQYAVEHHGRVLIGDDMGLGKTCQAIALVSYFANDWPVLVICPSSLRFNWASEFLKWLPNIYPSDINVIVNGKGQVQSSITICSYDLIGKLSSHFQNHKFGFVICDESHYLKSDSAVRTTHTLPLLSQSKRVILLSGTPALSRPIELFTQLHALQPCIFVHRHHFGVRYCAAVKGRFGWEYTGNSNLQELHALMRHFCMIRRLKSEVLQDLPEKRRQTMVYQVQDKELKASLEAVEIDELARRELKCAVDVENGHSSEAQQSLQISPKLLQLYSQSGIAKLGMIEEFITDLIESCPKFLVFAHHKKVLDGIQAIVVKHKVGFVRIDGSTKAQNMICQIGYQDRQLFVESFQNDESVKIAVLSITAASQGLTLTAASTVVFAELYWTPAILTQAEDRVYRIGQRNSCNMMYLLGQNTIDDVLWPMISKKLEVVSSAVDGNRFVMEHETHRKQRSVDVDNKSGFIGIPIQKYFSLSAASSARSASSSSKIFPAAAAAASSTTSTCSLMGISSIISLVTPPSTPPLSESDYLDDESFLLNFQSSDT